VQVITMRARASGRWFSGFSKHGANRYFFAELRPSEENSCKLLAQAKDNGLQRAINSYLFNGNVHHDIAIRLKVMSLPPRYLSSSYSIKSEFKTHRCLTLDHPITQLITQSY
jgi:hypothetical protein